MYSGIIYHNCEIYEVQKTATGIHFSVKVACSANVKEGDSTGIDGVCLTAVKIENDLIYYDACAETLSRTTLATLTPGRKCHFELSLKHGEFNGGHNVLGHVDFTAPISIIEKVADSAQIKIWYQISKEFSALIPLRGCVAVDGVSLTVTDKKEDSFSVSIIPATEERTHITTMKTGDKVNIEVDSSGRYLQDDNGILNLQIPEECTPKNTDNELEKAQEYIKNGGAILICSLENHIEKSALILSCQTLKKKALVFALGMSRSPLMLACHTSVAEQLSIPAPVINAPHGERRYLLPISHIDNTDFDYSFEANLKTLSLFCDKDTGPEHWKSPGFIFPIQVYNEDCQKKPELFEASVAMMRTCHLAQSAICQHMLAADGSFMNHEQAKQFATRFSLPILAIDEVIQNCSELL